ncbi:hypothetical protein ACFQGT_19520 [Natrialbaceae archaeon GCM10025810]|uniref:hypothetical protein n=1 Tax=Halovalidus salilacus TaxID=3075124 RepID=UPI003623DC55
MRGTNLTRRRVLRGVTAGGIGLSAGRAGVREARRIGSTADARAQAGDLEVTIVDAGAPVGAGDYLDVTAEITNAGSTDVRVDVDLVVGHDPERMGGVRTTVDAGETYEYNGGFQTYPVPSDDEFPVRVEVDGGVAADERTVGVRGAADLPDASPDGDLSVAPGTEVLFEAGAAAQGGSQQTIWWVDGERASDSLDAWPGEYMAEQGAHYHVESFDSSGSHNVAAAVIPDGEERTYAARWSVDATSGGHSSPVVEAARPSDDPVSVAEGETVPFGLTASDPDGDLDRVVWWLTQADVILDVTDLEGARDTATISYEGTCHTCVVNPWVIAADGTVTTDGPNWEIRRAEDGGGGGQEGELLVSIRSTDSPVDAGEYLEVIVDVENTGDAPLSQELELVVGHDPKLLDTQEVIVDPGETGAATLGFETYPTRQHERFPVRVVGEDDDDRVTVEVYPRG